MLWWSCCSAIHFRCRFQLLFWQPPLLTVVRIAIWFRLKSHPLHIWLKFSSTSLPLISWMLERLNQLPTFIFCYFDRGILFTWKWKEDSIQFQAGSSLIEILEKKCMLFAEDCISFSHIPENLQAWIYSQCWKGDKMYIQVTQARIQIPASKRASVYTFPEKILQVFDLFSLLG